MSASGHCAETSYGQQHRNIAQQQQPSSSSTSHISLPSINLPPITDLDAGAASSQQPLPQHHHHQQTFPPQLPFAPHQLTPAQAHHPPPHLHHMAQLPPGPMPIGGGGGGGYPYPPGQSPLPAHPPHAMGVNQDPNAPHRYPLQPDNRMMHARGHKKEIKRRTKTGCLTCRKRRIKCDEGHPTCRNCMKSKRECLGYDPIFKAQPGPTNIQPAPNASAQIPPPNSASPYPAPSPSYGPATAHPYPPTAMPTGASASSATPDHRMDYSTSAIDPALENSQHALASPYFPATFDTRSILVVKPTAIEELLNVGLGSPPPLIPQLSSIPPEKREEIRSVFLTIYGPGMDKFFESRWFTNRGIQHLLSDQRLCEKYIALMGRFNITATNNYQENLVTQSLEAHVIWESLLLCRQVSASIVATNDTNNQVEVDAGVHDASKRLRAFECLITNQQADAEFPTKMDEFWDSSKGAAGLNAQLVDRERNFWKQLALLTSLKDEGDETIKPDANLDPAMTGEQLPKGDKEKIDACMREIRSLLDSRENRDILYSVAVTSHVAHQIVSRGPKDGAKAEPIHESEEDPRTKLHVARTFIQNESGGKGTTQVAQRICGMVIRSWVPVPGR